MIKGIKLFSIIDRIYTSYIDTINLFVDFKELREEPNPAFYIHVIEKTK